MCPVHTEKRDFIQDWFSTVSDICQYSIYVSCYDLFDFFHVLSGAVGNQKAEDELWRRVLLYML